MLEVNTTKLIFKHDVQLLVHRNLQCYSIVTRRLMAFVDIPTPVVLRAEVTADNTTIRVLWEWSNEGVPMCVDLVRVDYQPEGGSLMMYTVGSTTATSATLPNLQCNTEYTIWVHASGGSNDTRSAPRMVYIPARGMYEQ